MKIINLTKVLFITLSMTLFSFVPQNTWFKTGNKPDSYYMGIDKDSNRKGQNVNTIKSIDEKIDGFGSMAQTFLPDKYLGKRVRMTGYIKTKDVNEWAGLWFRADQKDFAIPLSFDNMHDSKIDRSIKGTNDWSKYEIVLEIPLNSAKLVYGILLSGTGQLWFDEINFEVVNNDIPTTGYLSFANILYDKISKEGIKKGITLYDSLKRNSSQNYNFNEFQLNTLGYILLSEKKINDAIEIFKLNTIEYPKSANVYDSLGEAFYNAGDTSNALKCYEKALELDPSLQTSIDMLKKLRK